MADNKPTKKPVFLNRIPDKGKPIPKTPAQPNKRAMFGDSTARVFTRNIRSA